MTPEAVQPTPTQRWLASRAAREGARAILEDGHTDPADCVALVWMSWLRALQAWLQFAGANPPPVDAAQVLEQTEQSWGRVGPAAAADQNTWIAAARDAWRKHQGLRDGNGTRPDGVWVRQQLAWLGSMHRMLGPPMGMRGQHNVLRTLATAAVTALVVGGIWGSIQLAGRTLAHVPGWRAQYFSTPDLSGPPLVQTDAQLAFHWDESAPLPGMPADGFSVRWDGCLPLTVDQDVTFSLGSDDGSRLWVNGQKVVDSWKPQGLKWTQGKVNLGAGTHHVRVEFFDTARMATVKLKVGFGAQEPRLLEPGEVLLPFLVDAGAVQCQEPAP